MEQLRMIHKTNQIPTYPLADGFSLRLYQPGDEVKVIIEGIGTLETTFR